MPNTRHHRTEAFRRSHRVGQHVRGTLVRWEGPGLGWVDIDGHWLLARLGGGASPGQVLEFEITRLTPDIVLRQLGHPAGGEGGLVDACRELSLARVRLEASKAFASAGNTGGREAFLSALAQDPGAVDRLAQLMALQEEVNQGLGGRARFGYAPWLIPGARRVELLTLSGTGPETDNPDLLLGLELPRMGAARVHFTETRASEGFWIYLERLELRRDFLAFVELHSDLLDGLACLGVLALPPEATVGLLGELERLLRPGRRLSRIV
ncbi:MAG: hypothetical protein ACOCVM_05775 [Desulfovibrionaceae bacterium]